MDEMLLLGAGASVEAGIPDAYRMSERILERFRSDPRLRKHAHVLSFAVGGLFFQAGVRNENPYSGVNVEDLFNAIQLLAQRGTLEAAPFIGSWHHMVEEFDRANPSRLDADRLTRTIQEAVSQSFTDGVPSLSSSEESRINKALTQTMARIDRGQAVSGSGTLGREIVSLLQTFATKWVDRSQRTRPRGSRSSQLDRELGKAVRRHQPQPGAGDVFHRTNSLMIEQLRDLVWIGDASRVAHLEPLLAKLKDQRRLVIATLNYDNAVEILADQHDVPCDTGLDHWSESRRFDFAGAGLKLLKLHGSIDWVKRRSPGSGARPLPHAVIERIVDPQQSENAPAVIFGQRNKLTAEGPFLDLIAAFRRELDTVSLLTVVGYSFRDAHVNEYITQWINEDPNRRLRVVDPGFETNASAYARDLQAHLRDRLTVIAEGAGAALATLYTNRIAGETGS